MTENCAKPMIRFYCPKCGKEMWEGVDWKDARRYTKHELSSFLMCSGCLSEEIRADKGKEIKDEM